jgi:hypothetical protein
VENIKVGDRVYVPKGALERCDIVDVDNEVKLMVSDFDVAIIW